MTREKYEAGKKAEAAKARSGFAPSEASEKELNAHKKDKGVIAAMNIRKATAEAGKQFKQPVKPLGDPNISPSPFAIKSSTAGTTPRGLQPATSSTVSNTNYLGSGPNPLDVSNSMLSVKKKTTLK